MGFGLSVIPPAEPAVVFGLDIGSVHRHLVAVHLAQFASSGADQQHSTAASPTNTAGSDAPGPRHLAAAQTRLHSQCTTVALLPAMWFPASSRRRHITLITESARCSQPTAA